MQRRLAPGYLGLSIALLGAVGAAAASIAAARHYYLQRAELRLHPVRSDEYQSANAALPGPTGKRVVFFGDSRINGWTPRPRSGEMEMIWRGIDGETTAQMILRFQQDVLDLRPHAVVIQAGINDLVAGVALGRGDRVTLETAVNLQRLAEMGSSAGVHVYLLTVLKPSTPTLWRLPVWSSDIYPLVDSVNVRIRGLAGNGVAVIESDRQLSGDEGRMPKHLSRDTLHPNEHGYEMLNEMIEDALGVRSSAIQ